MHVCTVFFPAYKYICMHVCVHILLVYNSSIGSVTIVVCACYPHSDCGRLLQHQCSAERESYLELGTPAAPE